MSTKYGDRSPLAGGRVRHRRVLPGMLAGMVVVLGWFCTPGGNPGGLNDACWTQDDCADGEICSPGALRCVRDFRVEEGEFAGSFEFILRPPLDAGFEQKFLLRASLQGHEYDMTNSMTMSVTQDGSTFILGFRGLTVDEQHIMQISVPQAAFNTETLEAPLGDGLAWDPDQPRGSGRIEIYERETFQTKYIAASIQSGTFRFTRIDREEDGQTWKLGGTITGEFQGTLQPPTYSAQAMTAPEKCTSQELVDPKTYQCIPAFSGMDALMGLDSVYNGNAILAEGAGAVSYRGETHELRHVQATGCSSIDSGDHVLVGAQWVGGGTECLTSSDCHPPCNPPCGEEDLCLQGSCTPASGFVACASEDDCGEGEQCHPWYFACVDKVYCIYDYCMVAKELPFCDTDADCTSPERCGYQYTSTVGICAETFPRHLEVTIPRSLITEGAELSHGSQYQAVLYAAFEVQGQATLATGPPIGGFTSGGMTIRHFHPGDNGRLFLTLWGYLDIDPGGTLGFGAGCSVSDDQCMASMECLATTGPDTGQCATTCTTDDNCYGGLRCALLDGFYGGESRRICVPALDPYWSGCDASAWILCDTGNVCVTITFAPTEMTNPICLPECDASSGSGCTGEQFCMPLDSGSAGGCFRALGRNEACYYEEAWLNAYHCDPADICVTNTYGDSYCRKDCTYTGSCPAGFSCGELTDGRRACQP